MKFREVNLKDPEQGEIKLLISIPTELEPWGVLGVLRDTEWEGLIQVVSGEALSHALHGWATPLAREVGVSPRRRGLRLSEGAGRCALFQECLSAGAHCRPGNKKLPSCYEAPHVTPEGSQVASRVALAWRENRLVVVVDGEEHALS